MPLRKAANEVGRRMLATPEGAQRLALAEQVRADPGWKWFVDACGQPYRGWNNGQLAYLHKLFELWATGRLAIGRFPVDCTPSSDKHRERNQAALTSGLGAITKPTNPGFVVHVDLEQDASPYGDGWLMWTNEVVLGMRVGDRSSAEAWAHVAPFDPERGGVPLEIGHTDTQTTYFHLASGMGLARWPYGSEHVLLIIPSDFVREAVREDNSAVRWKPERMPRPGDVLASTIRAAEQTRTEPAP